MRGLEPFPPDRPPVRTVSEHVDTRIAVVGLGYVGLPLAVAFAGSFPTVGFDIDGQRVRALREGDDATGEVTKEDLRSSRLRVTDDLDEIGDCNVYIVTVPTPVDDDRRPDLGAVTSAARSVASVLSPGDLVIYESTVYPGVTEELCGRILAEGSGLTAGRDFHVGYSPERINPGDRTHTIHTIVKVVAGDTPETTDRMAALYGSIVEAGVYCAASIRVAEAAKVIENTQRDLNIALMNELSIIFERMGIRTKDVLDAAGTKWNFLPFVPGLVGGHCIGVDPYYLTAKAQQLGYHPEVILAGRRINDGMGAFIAQKVVRMLAQGERPIRDTRVGVLGLTFKENVPDLRNSRVPDLIGELESFGIRTVTHDPVVAPEAARRAYGIEASPWEGLEDLDALVLAVPHRDLIARGVDGLTAPLREGGIVVDVKSVLEPGELRADLRYWSL